MLKPLPGHPHQNGIVNRNLSTRADYVVLVVPALTAIRLNRQFKRTVHEPRLGNFGLVGLDSGTDLSVKATLLTTAAEKLIRRKEIEVGLIDFTGNIYRIDGTCAYAEVEPTCIFKFLDLVHEIAVFGAVGSIAAGRILKLIIDAAEVIEAL